MYRISALAVAALLTVTSAAQSAVSGYYNSVEQMNAILQSQELGDALNQLPVTSLIMTGTRRDGAIEWTVKTKRCRLKLYLIAVPPQGLGKTTYRLETPNSCK